MRTEKGLLTKSFCEIFGILIGDGCISIYKRSDGFTNYEIGVTGNLKLDVNHHKYLEKLFINEFGISLSKYFRKKDNVIRTSVRNKNLVNLFLSI